MYRRVLSPTGVQYVLPRAGLQSMWWRRRCDEMWRAGAALNGGKALLKLPPSATNTFVHPHLHEPHITPSPRAPEYLTHGWHTLPRASSVPATCPLPWLTYIADTFPRVVSTPACSCPPKAAIPQAVLNQSCRIQSPSATYHMQRQYTKVLLSALCHAISATLDVDLLTTHPAVLLFDIRCLYSR